MGLLPVRVQWPARYSSHLGTTAAAQVGDPAHWGLAAAQASVLMLTQASRSFSQLSSLAPYSHLPAGAQQAIFEPSAQRLLPSSASRPKPVSQRGSGPGAQAPSASKPAPLLPEAPDLLPPPSSQAPPPSFSQLHSGYAGEGGRGRGREGAATLQACMYCWACRGQINGRNQGRLCGPSSQADDHGHPGPLSGR